MNLLYLGMICLVIVAGVCLYFGYDGAIIASIVGLIAGAAGFGVQKAKDAIAPSPVNVPVTTINADTKVLEVVEYKVPVKVAKMADNVTIDFNKVELDISSSIDKMNLDHTPEQIAAFAVGSAMGARVSSVDEVIQWNDWLMKKSLAAVASMFKVAGFQDKKAMDEWLHQYLDVGCHPILLGQKVAIGWVNTLDGQSQALSRLQKVGIDWAKIAEPTNTAWYIAELAYNPVVAIGVTSEDITE
jgi:hypothetical protein